MTNRKTFQLAAGGICLALTMAFLLGASFVPGMELTLYALSSVFIAVMIIETGLKGGVILYAAAVILGALLIPNKLAILPYACVFGIYGIVKYEIEKIKTPIVQILLKIIFFGGVLAVFLFFFEELIMGSIALPDYSKTLLLAGGIVMLMLYDFIYTLLIALYRKRIQRSPEPGEIILSRPEKKE